MQTGSEVLHGPHSIPRPSLDLPPSHPEAQLSSSPASSACDQQKVLESVALPAGRKPRVGEGAMTEDMSPPWAWAWAVTACCSWAGAWGAQHLDGGAWAQLRPVGPSQEALIPRPPAGSQSHTLTRPGPLSFRGTGVSQPLLGGMEEGQAQASGKFQVQVLGAAHWEARGQ